MSVSVRIHLRHTVTVSKLPVSPFVPELSDIRSAFSVLYLSVSRDFSDVTLETFAGARAAE